MDEVKEYALSLWTFERSIPKNMMQEGYPLNSNVHFVLKNRIRL